MKKFGTFSGVFVPSFEAILGAVLFLILPLLVGQVGMVNMLIIVLLANTATLATAFSISDSATNLSDIGPGGMYAISKQSLGRAFGGSIGIQIYVAQAVSIGFYCIGFAEPIEPLLRQLPFVIEISETFGLTILQRKQIIASLFALISFAVAIAGADFVSRLQMVILVVLVVSIAAIMIAPLLNPQLDGAAIFTIEPNLYGAGARIGFAAAFAIFFPAVTGIDAGVGMSGSLKTPQRSLVVGTFAAIAVTTLVYGLVTVIFGFVNPQLLLPQNGVAVSTLDLFAQTPVLPLILITGILLATSSSALSYFLTAPRTMQALVQDNVLPRFLGFLGRDFTARGSEPRLATVLTFLITIGIVWSGDIAFVSLIVGICFLIVYGWVNFSAFLERASGNPSFRPSSKGHWIISLYGFVLCLAIVAMFNLFVGIAVAAVQIGIFMLLLKYKTQNRLEGVWWGALFAFLHLLQGKMTTIIQGTKNWRPIVGAFAFNDVPSQIEGINRMSMRLIESKGIVSQHRLVASKEMDAELAVQTEDGAGILYYWKEEINPLLMGMIQAAPPAGFGTNTVLLPVDSRFDAAAIIEQSLRLSKHVLLYKPDGRDVDARAGGKNRIDVWWKGAENGNLMALLAHVINFSEQKNKLEKSELRFLRKLWGEENRADAQHEMEELLRTARLHGEILIIDADDKPIHDTVSRTSEDASLVFLGLPGEPAGNLARMFNLDQFLFQKNFEPYKKMPEMLFVKAAHILDLEE
ncbi:amino acid permease [Spirochaeta dissipatitropha]